MAEIERRSSSYVAADVGIGIVHLGLGAFHRGHQAAYVEANLSRHHGGPWGICAANLRSNRSLPAALAAQNYRYHIAEFKDAEHLRITEINAIRRALFAPDDSAALVAILGAPTTRIVSLTVSEKGYYLNPVGGELLRDAPEIVHDLRDPEAPRTAPGYLVEALRLRRASGTPPFTVLCCDNMPTNGKRTRSAVVSLAAERSNELAEWVANEVAFPNSMVDRIVPKVSAAKAQQLDELIGCEDRAAVACEAFSQWVIEDNFRLGRPDWENDGVEMVKDVEFYETAKLRILNGAHSLLAYQGLCRNLKTVAEAVADPKLLQLTTEFLDQAGASLDIPPGFDLANYKRSVIERFRNDALAHLLQQIAMDGSQKIPQRWLQAAQRNLERDRPISAIAAGVAAWMRYVRGQDDNGQHWLVDDPLAARLADCHRRNADVRDTVADLLAIESIFAPSLAAYPAFRTAVIDAYLKLPHAADNA